MREIFLSWSKFLEIGGLDPAQRPVWLKRELATWPFFNLFADSLVLRLENPPTSPTFDQLRKISRIQTTETRVRDAAVR